MPTCTKRETPARSAAASAFFVPGHVAALEVLRVAPGAEVRREVKGHGGARGPLRHRLHVVQVTPHRLGAEGGHGAAEPSDRASARTR